MKRNDYKTKQKETILNIIKNQEKDFTVREIYDELDKKVGLTTIYRLVDKLVIEEKIDKYISKDNKTFYRYLESCNSENHFYLKCDKCKNMIHIDCECINDLANHISKEHRFIPKKENIIINGICNNCKVKKK